MAAFLHSRIVVCAALAAFSAGCIDVDDREIIYPPAEPTLSPSTQWAGGVVRVALEDIDPDDTAPELSAGLEALTVIAVGEGWVDYKLPTTARGEVELELGGERPRSFEVRVVGFRSAKPLGVALEGNLFVWPRVGRASLLAVDTDGPTGGVIQILPGSLEARQLVQDPALFWGSDVRSVVPTYDPNRFILLRSEITNSFPNDHWAELWRLLPTPEIIDTLPLGVIRHAMLLSDSVYVWSGHHEIFSRDPRSGGPWLYWGQYEETQGMVVSPSGRYGAVRVNGSVLGPPVFSSESGVPPFHVDTLFRSYGVDFSPVGDTLYIAGIRRQPEGSPLLAEHLVLAYDATTGELVDGLELGTLEPINLVRDPNRAWLYVLVGQATAPPMMLVIDTRTMEVAGEIATTDAYLGCMGGCEGAVAVGTDGIFFVTSSLNRRLSVVLAFDGWPLY